MGLDMYLMGFDNGVECELGYWRKHPDLHGYICREFADGVDECQRIPLTKDNMRVILAATRAGDLETTTGFFFGESRPEDAEHTIAIFEKALKWKAEDPFVREVVYQASW